MPNLTSEELAALKAEIANPGTLTTSLGEPPEGTPPTHRLMPTWALVNALMADLEEERERNIKLVARIRSMGPGYRLMTECLSDIGQMVDRYRNGWRVDTEEEALAGAEKK